jgi:hypothetical protein
MAGGQSMLGLAMLGKRDAELWATQVMPETLNSARKP